MDSHFKNSSHHKCRSPSLASHSGEIQEKFVFFSCSSSLVPFFLQNDQRSYDIEPKGGGFDLQKLSYGRIEV